MRPPDTLGGLIDRGQRLWLACHTCNRDLDCDVYDLATRFGPGTVWVARRWAVKCASCGGRDIGMIMPGDSRSETVVRQEGPKNMRSTRTVDERRAALAMIDDAAKAGLGVR